MFMCQCVQAGVWVYVSVFTQVWQVHIRYVCVSVY